MLVAISAASRLTQYLKAPPHSQKVDAMKKPPQLRWLVVLLLLGQALTPAHATQEQIVTAETRKLLADRAWFSQIARVQQHTDPVGGGAVQERRASGSCSPDGACLVVTELLQPGATVEGYELVERTALLGVCDQQPRSGTGGGSPPAQIAHEQQQTRGRQIDGVKEVTSEDDEALELTRPLDKAASESATQEEGEERDSSAENESEQGDSSESNDGANPVCALPIALHSSDATGNQVAQTAASYERLADGPTLEYQVSLHPCLRAMIFVYTALT